MSNSCKSSAVIAALVLLAPPGRSADSVRFETHIRPILEMRCLRCQGEGRIQGGLDLHRSVILRKGGDSRQFSSMS